MTYSVDWKKNFIQNTGSLPSNPIAGQLAVSNYFIYTCTSGGASPIWKKTIPLQFAQATLPVVSSGLKLFADAGQTFSYTGTGTNWKDLSADSRNITLVNSPTYNSALNGTLLFNGSNQYGYFSTTGLPYGSSASTMVAWAKLTSLVNGYGWIMGYGNGASSQCRMLGVNNTTFQFAAYANDVTYSGASAGVWFHIAGVYNGTTAYLYINGSLATSATKSWNTIEYGANVGLAPFGGNEYWNGSIAQAAIYDSALSAGDISNLFESTRELFGV